MNNPDIFTAINHTADQIEAYAIPLSEDKINTVPYPNSWTAAQLLRHLIKSTTLMTQALQAPGEPATRDPRARIEELRQIFLDTPQQLRSPDVIIPEAIRYEKDNLLREWQQSFLDFNAAASTAEASGLVTGLPLGPITKLEIIHFVLYHSQRHLIQMKKITAAV